MALITQPGQIESFVLNFQLACSTRPEGKPDPYPNQSITRIVVGYGMMQIHQDDGNIIHVEIGSEHLVDRAKFNEQATFLAEHICTLMQTPHVRHQVAEALKEREGVVGHFMGRTLMFNPLTTGTGEVEHTP